MMGDPESVRLSVEFLGADDVSIAETGTSGAQSGVNALGFMPITVLTTAPAGAVNAVVTVALAVAGRQRHGSRLGDHR